MLKSQVFVAAAILSLSFSTLARADEPSAKPSVEANHAAHKKHKHQHGSKDCNHKAEKHGDHIDYEHDGHHHKKHGEHWDECAGPEADAAKK